MVKFTLADKFYTTVQLINRFNDISCSIDGCKGKKDYKHEGKDTYPGKKGVYGGIHLTWTLSEKDMPLVPVEPPERRVYCCKNRGKTDNRVFSAMGIIFCNPPSRINARYKFEKIMAYMMASQRKYRTHDNCTCRIYKVCMSCLTDSYIIYNLEKTIYGIPDCNNTDCLTIIHDGGCYVH